MISMDNDLDASALQEPVELTAEERASVEAFARLTPVQRFDQVVRTARFISAGRNGIRRHEPG
jgi:hypothetical protein